MAFKLSKEAKQKEFIFRDGDVEVYWRPIPKHVRDSIQRKHTKRGITDWIAVADDALQYAITGWNDKIVDEATGQPVAFAADLIEHLPLSWQTSIYEDATEKPASAEERQLGN